VGTVRDDESDDGGLRPDLTSGRGLGIVEIGGRIEEVEEGREEESFDFVGGLFSFTVASRDVTESLTVLDRMEEGAASREIEEEEEGVGRGIPGASEGVPSETFVVVATILRDVLAAEPGTIDVKAVRRFGSFRLSKDRFVAREDSFVSCRRAVGAS